MIPPIIERKLSGLRRWERLLRFLWGAARCLGVVVAILILACVTDWLVDRFYATPYSVRISLFVIQLAAGLALGWLWLLRPTLARIRPSDTALMVEEKTPELKHRLISVVQFSGPGADTSGMSPALIAKVTEETTERTARLNFTRAADHRRLKWSAAVALPVLAIALIPFLVWPELTQVLLMRQMLWDVDIPRSVYIQSSNPKVWPKGEDMVLRFQVAGSGWSKDSLGTVRIDPEDQPSLYFELEYESSIDDTHAVFVSPPKAKRREVKLPTITNFTYRAWLEDGRTADASAIAFEPRPVIDSKEIQAWAMLPPYCPVRPSGLPYEIQQSRGDIVAVYESSAKVKIQIQKPVEKATLQLLGHVPITSNPIVLSGIFGMIPSPGAGSLDAVGTLGGVAFHRNLQQQLVGPEEILEKIPMNLLGDGSKAEVVFSLPDTASGYRLLVEDEFGFKNIPAPRRSIRLIEEPPPEIVLLPVVHNQDEERALDGSAATLTGKGTIRIAYACSGEFGIGKVIMHYRVVQETLNPEDGSVTVKESKWLPYAVHDKVNLMYRQGMELPAAQVPDKGRFLHHLGIFENCSDADKIYFYAQPSPMPERILGKKKGGGRFDFSITALPDESGKPLTLQEGDAFEYYFEVYPATNKKYEESLRPVGKSMVRTTTFIDPQSFQAFLQEQYAKAQLKKIEQGQGAVDPFK